MNVWRVSIIVLGLLAMSGPSLLISQEKEPPRPLNWGDETKQMQYSGDVNEALSRHQQEALEKDADDGDELETMPIIGDEEETEEEAETDSENIGRTKADPGRKKSFVFVPEEDTAPDTPLPGLDLVEEETELETAPLVGSGEERASRLNKPRSITVSLDKNRIHLDESFILRVEVTVQDLKELKAFLLPKINHFDLINRNRIDSSTTIKGSLWRIRTMEYVFLGKQPGRYEIDPIHIKYGDAIYNTKPVKVLVEGTKSGVAYRRRFTGVGYDQNKIIPGAPEATKTDKEGMLFTAEVDNDDVYVNQQVELSIRMQYKSDDKTNVVYTPPMVTGFLTEPLPPTNREEQISSTKQRLLDKRYRTALFPIRAGHFAIGMAQAYLSHRGKTKEFMTDTITVKVKPLPQDPKPVVKDSPNVLVGYYQLQANWDMKEQEEHSPLRLTFKLIGKGNLRRSLEPVFKRKNNYRVFLENKEDFIKPAQDTVQGEKHFTYLIVFEKKGSYRLGKAVIRFFDLQSKSWKSAECSIPPIVIIPQQEQIRTNVKTKDVAVHELNIRRHHSGRSSLKTGSQQLWQFWQFWLIQLMGPLLIGVVVMSRYYYKQAQADQKALCIRKAYKQAKRSLRQLKHWIYEGEVKNFYDGLTKTTTEFLAAKFSVPTSYIGAERIDVYFSKYQIPDYLVNRFKVALTACEYVRYAAVTLPVRDMHALHKDLHGAIKAFEVHWKQMEKQKKATGTFKASGLIIGFLLVSGGAWAGEKELLLTQGNGLIEQQKFIEAEDVYKRLIRMGIHDADVYYNLGNAYLYQAKLGEAVLAYEKALIRAPRDWDSRHNLGEAKALIAQQNWKMKIPWWRKATTRLFEIMTAHELVVASTICYWIIIFLVVCLVLFPGRKRLWKKSLITMLLVTFLIVIWSTARTTQHYWWPRAVVIAEQTELYTRPYHQAEVMLEVPEGATVHVIETEEAWVEIRIGVSQRGWVKRHTLGFIN